MVKSTRAPFDCPFDVDERKDSSIARPFDPFSDFGFLGFFLNIFFRKPIILFFFFCFLPEATGWGLFRAGSAHLEGVGGSMASDWFMVEMSWMKEMLGSDSVWLVAQDEFLTELGILGEFGWEDFEEFRVFAGEFGICSFFGFFLHSIIKF